MCNYYDDYVIWNTDNDCVDCLLEVVKVTLTCEDAWEFFVEMQQEFNGGCVKEILLFLSGW